MKKELNTLCARFTCFVFFAVCPLYGQTTTGDILGTVRDQTGAVVPGATITLTNMETNVSAEAVSDDAGNYVLARLRPGRYRLTAQVTGFKQGTVSDVVLLVDQRPRIDFALELGEMSAEQIVVEGGAILLESEKASLGQVIEEKRIKDLPLNGRNFMQLALLSAGVVPIGIGVSPVTSWTGRSDQSASISGGRESSNSYLVDGVETRNSRFGSTGIRPSIDAIQEFKIHRNTYSAEFGHGAAIINTAVKSGGNDFHGTIFEFIRNDNLDSRGFFDIGRLPEFKQNNFGAALGGPILRDRLFFFGNYEGFRQRRAREHRLYYPEPRLLEGNLSSLPIQPGLNVAGVTIFDPLTGQPFAGNIIPRSRFSSVATNLIPYIPVPNALGFDPLLNINTVENLTNMNDWDQYHVRIDHSLGAKDSLFYRYSFSDEDIFLPQIAELRGERFPQSDHNVAISEIHTFRPNLVNEFRFGYNRSETFRVSEGSFGEDIAAMVGIKNTTTNPFSFGIPNIGISNFSSFGSIPQSIGATEDVFQWTDHLSWTRGRHTLKLGGDVRRDSYFQDTNFAGNPTFNFTGQFSCRGVDSQGVEVAGSRIRGCAIADYLLGFPLTVSASVGDSRQNLRNIFMGLYVQDDWKLHPRVTLNFGLRYELDTSPIEIDDKMKFFDASSGTVKVVGQDAGVPRSIVPNDLNNFAPRIGVAFKLSEKTVLRAGYGVYYDLVNWNELQFHIIGPPFFQSLSLNSRPTQPDFFLDQMLPSFEFNPALTFPFSLDQQNRTPYVHQYSFNLQQQLTSDLLLEIGYAGSAGHKLGQRLNLNQGRVDPTGLVPLAERVRYPQFSAILWSYNGGNSTYNELTVRADKRYRAGLSLLGSYTWSKSLDSGHTDEFAGNIFNLKGDRGPSTFDARQRFVASYSYDLPWGQGRRYLASSGGILNHLVSGWQVNGISTFMSGQPRNVGFIGRPPVVGPFANVRANRLGPGDCSECRADIRKNPVPGPYFRLSDFAVPADFTFGNAGRNVLTAPGTHNWDISVFKNNRISETLTLQFRAEFFNAFNHAQFTTFNSTVGSPDYGRVTGAREARDIQFALRLIF
jgi:Carboxypeptidase regulatory-like domain/TonB dependent receptor-like, beta-barrel